MEEYIDAYNYYDSLSCVDYVEIDSIVIPTNVQDEKTNPSIPCFAALSKAFTPALLLITA